MADQPPIGAAASSRKVDQALLWSHAGDLHDRVEHLTKAGLRDELGILFQVVGTWSGKVDAEKFREETGDQWFRDFAGGRNVAGQVRVLFHLNPTE